MEDLIHQKNKCTKARDVFLMEHARSRLMMVMTMVFVALFHGYCKVEVGGNLIEEGGSFK